MWIETIPTWGLCVIVFLTQHLFIFARTMNVIYTAEHNTVGALISGTFVHLSWLLSIAIGVKSVMYLDFWVIACSLTGGLLGTYLGIRLKKYLNKRKL